MDQGNNSTFDQAESEIQESQESVSILPQGDIVQEESDFSFDENSGFSESSDLQLQMEESKLNETINDKFEGVLYNILSNDSTNRFSIMFSNPDLYSKFIKSLEKEIEPQRPVTEMTRIEDQSCVITAHENESSISVKGPGSKLWCDTRFQLHATKLFQEYASETNEIIEGLQHPTAVQTNSQSSTPHTNRRLQNDTPWSPVRVEQTSDTLLKQISDSQNEIKDTQSEMKGQLATLMELVLNLQGQLNEVKTKSKIQTLKQENDEIEDLSQSAHETENLNNSNTQAKEPPTHTPEMNTTYNVMPGEASYSQIVAHRDEVINISHEQTTTNQNTIGENVRVENAKDSESRSTQKESRAQLPSSEPRAPAQTANKTIIIGDSLLAGVNRKGLKNGVHCQSFSGATVSMIQEKIKMFDLSEFHNVVIYVGGNDSGNPVNMANFKDNYSKLLDYIRSKNTTCKIFVCGSCPRGDTDVEDINCIIKSLATSHNATFIDEYLAFYDNNRQLRTKFYGIRDWVHLSNSGVKRLLGTIHKFLPIVEDFHYVVYSHKNNVSAQKQFRPENRDQQSSERGYLSYQSGQHSQPQHNNRFDRNRSDVHPSNATTMGSHDQYESHQHHSRDQSDSWWTRGRNGRSQEKSTVPERCMKCGLTNHTTSACRHKRQLLCYSCHNYGHKDSICWNE